MGLIALVLTKSKSMKKLMLIGLTLLITFTVYAPPHSDYYRQAKTHYHWLEQEELRKLQEFESFLFHLKLRESGNNWKIINEYGYIGYYQFGKLALKTVGLDYINSKKFKNNPWIFPPQLQEKAVRQLIKINQQSLSKYYWRIGTVVNGITITESGMIAASHLVGASRVKRFLRTNGKYDYADANGTKLSNYLDEFKNYDF